VAGHPAEQGDDETGGTQESTDHPPCAELVPLVTTDAEEHIRTTCRVGRIAGALSRGGLRRRDTAVLREILRVDPKDPTGVRGHHLRRCSLAAVRLRCRHVRLLAAASPLRHSSTAAVATIV